MPSFDRSGAGDFEDEGAQTRRYIRLLVDCFPHVPIVSVRLLERNETFRELCEEYEMCMQTIERLQHNANETAMLSEYTALRLRLEGELLRYMSEQGDGNGHD